MTDEKLQALEKRVNELENRLGLAEGELAIRRLQRAYGYFMDKRKYQGVFIECSAKTYVRSPALSAGAMGGLTGLSRR